MAAEIMKERCSLDGHRGTIKYTGPVPPTEGIWYGVEWDEKRGKHDGFHEGVKYFACRPGHGSFVRPEKVFKGIDVIEALKIRYGKMEVENPDKLYVSGVNKQRTLVETVGFEKIQESQSQFQKIRHVGLSGMNVKGCFVPGSLAEVAPGINHLDISKNLLGILQDVFDITKGLQQLESLNLSDNKLDLSEESEYLDCSLDTVKVLALNRMQINWDLACILKKLAPNVEELHLCFNAVSSIRITDSTFNSLSLLNFEGNCITDWEDVLQLAFLPQLRKLILNNNKISKIYFPKSDDTKTDRFKQLEALSLCSNAIKEWRSINELNKLARLEDLRFKGNPIVEGMTTFDSRQELIARIARLSSVNGSPVTVKERKSAELAFLRRYTKDWVDGGGSNENVEEQKLTPEFIDQFPRFTELIKEHGAPVIQQIKTKSLKANLLTLTIKFPEDNSKREIKKNVPESMTVQQLKGLIQKLFKVVVSRQRLAYFDSKTQAEVVMEDNLRQLSFYSISSNDVVLVRS